MGKGVGKGEWKTGDMHTGQTGTGSVGYPRLAGPRVLKPPDILGDTFRSRDLDGTFSQEGVYVKEQCT